MAQESKRWLKFRIVTLMGLFLMLFIALITRAFQLQVLSGQALKNIASKQHTRTLQIEPERGIIFDRNGEKLAASMLTDSVCADPSKIRYPKDVAQKIAAVLDVDSETVLRKITTSKNFCWLARRIPAEQSAKVEGLNIDGIFLIKEPKRFYPNGELAGHLIGFVGLDSVGLEGLELKYDEYLKGTPEKLVWTRDAKGKRLYPHVEKAAVDNRASYNLILTIDGRIQHLVETQLKEAVKDKSAKGGYAMVMDPKTGEILALANEPSFDPNNFAKGNALKGKNKVITDCYDPGSTFKPFLVAGALEEKVVKETDRIFCENGNYVVADRVFHEAQRKRHGYLTVREVLKYSSNIGAAKIGERLGKEKFYQYIKKFGFGSKTGIDLPGESPGLLRPYKDWTRVDATTIAFGQGISVTAIQLITALSAIANDGVMMKPFIIRGIVDKQGQVMKEYRPEVARKVISPATAKRMTSILTGVVGEEDGTGKKARIDNVNVAGKTGTSQKFDFARHVYSSERVRTSFMGFFPSEAPQVVMLVVLDEPQRDKWGGVASAPVFKKIGEQILTCFKTHIRENASPVNKESIPDGGKIRLVTTAKPAQSENATEDGSPAEAIMPDFRGLTIRDVLTKAKSKNIEIKVVGNGWAVNQDPAPGAALATYRSCTVAFSTGQ
ncbi:MAG: penicillin-binding transpeptidase domain-containing protein [Syntrophales bacterium]|nr:penicillin-binding transpeptidase domain-containing protein [Syntrophales bacterium]